jgi:Membrane bound O-acyl transferase family
VFTETSDINNGIGEDFRLHPWVKWAPALLPPLLAIVAGASLPPWAWMWLIAASHFIASKWITIFPLLPGEVAPWPLIAYCLAWPGLDVHAFCQGKTADVPSAREWAIASVKLLFGAALLWFGTRRLAPGHPLIAGWVGMIGIVFLLHFGWFHLLALLWQAFGVEAKPIMRLPAAATSLAGFWGGRWNAAFTDLMHQHFFKPLARRYGARAALVLVFVISGILHETVISLPARGGYGWPTAYFLAQGVGLLVERSALGRRIGLGHGWTGWCFVLLVAGIPAYFLFHPIFIRHVILPMLHAIGAT